MNWQEYISKLIKSLRCDMTVKEFAKVTGLSPSYIYDMENGRTMPRIETLIKMVDDVNNAEFYSNKIELLIKLTEKQDNNESISD